MTAPVPRPAGLWTLSDRTLPDPTDPVVLYLIRTENISVTEAQHRVLMQSLAPVMAPVFARALGVGFGGTYLNDDGQLVVCVVGDDPAAASVIAHTAERLGFADDVVVRPVKYSESDLAAQSETVRRYLHAHYSHASWSFTGSIASQDVVVHLRSSDAAAIKADLESRYGDGSLSVRLAPGKAGRT